MSAIIITYDLSSPGRNYDDLYDRIKSYPGWAHITQSSWAIAPRIDPAAVRDHLQPALDNNDKLFVAVLGNAAWTGLDTDISDWIKNNL